MHIIADADDDLLIKQRQRKEEIDICRSLCSSFVQERQLTCDGRVS